MSLTHGVLALLTAKPGQEADLAAFLEAGRDMAATEPGTRTWYAFQVDGSTYGIFDTFEDESARRAHLDGRIPAALAEVADDLLASAPDIRLIDLVAVKDAA